MDMEPAPGSNPNVRDSVVSGDLHTGDVIHNHYHMSQPPPVPQRPPVPSNANTRHIQNHNQNQATGGNLGQTFNNVNMGGAAQAPHHQQSFQNPHQNQAQYPNYYQQHGARHPTNSPHKDVLFTYILWFFLGAFGAHRFYLNQVGMGIFYFLTLGGCGLLWLIDIVLIPDLVNRANRTYIRN